MTADIDEETARLDPTLPTVEKTIQYEENNQPRKGLHPAFFVMLVNHPEGFCRCFRMEVDN